MIEGKLQRKEEGGREKDRVRQRPEQQRKSETGEGMNGRKGETGTGEGSNDEVTFHPFRDPTVESISYCYCPKKKYFHPLFWTVRELICTRVQVRERVVGGITTLTWIPLPHLLPLPFYLLTKLNRAQLGKAMLPVH